MIDEPSNHIDIENLIVGHFDDTLTEEQERDLAKVLTTSTEAKQLFLSYMRMEGRLHSLGRDGFLREPIEERAIEPEFPSQQTDSAPVGQNGRQRLRLIVASTSLAVCAVVLLLLTSGVLWPSTVSANSVLQEAQQAAAELIDRTYRLVVSHPKAEGVPARRELRITVRGGGRFVVQPEHGAYVMGSDGTDYWMARRNGPVFVTGDYRKLTPELQRQIPNRRLLDDVLASPDEPLLLDMASLLLLIERRYDIGLVHSPNSAQHRVRATRRSGVRGGPSVIILEADVESGLVLKAELNFADSRQRIFELVETPTRSDQWYHYSEHAPGRRVERLDAAD